MEHHRPRLHCSSLGSDSKAVTGAKKEIIIPCLIHTPYLLLLFIHSEINIKYGAQIELSMTESQKFDMGGSGQLDSTMVSAVFIDISLDPVSNTFPGRLAQGDPGQFYSTEGYASPDKLKVWTDSAVHIFDQICLSGRGSGTVWLQDHHSRNQLHVFDADFAVDYAFLNPRMSHEDVFQLHR